VQNEYSLHLENMTIPVAKAVTRSRDLFWMLRSFSEYPLYTFILGMTTTRENVEDAFRNVCASMREHREFYEATHPCGNR